MCLGKQNTLSSFRRQAATVNWQDNFGQRREAFQKACKEYDVRQKDWIDSKRKRKNYKGTLVDIDLSSRMMIWCLSWNDLIVGMTGFEGTRQASKRVVRVLSETQSYVLGCMIKQGFLSRLLHSLLYHNILT